MTERYEGSIKMLKDITDLVVTLNAKTKHNGRVGGGAEKLDVVD